MEVGYKMLNESLWVCGTDTGIGKTYVTSLLGLYLQGHEKTFGLSKPVAAGVMELMGDPYNEDVEALKSIVVGQQTSQEICPWQLERPMGPWSAAQKEGVVLSAKEIAAHVLDLEQKHKMIVAETVGGIYVPLNENETFCDVVEITKWPCVLVVGMKLGCISQCLMTLELLEKRGIEVKAVFLNSHSLDISEEVYESSKAEISSRFSNIIELKHISSYPMALAQLEKHSNLIKF
jgi:dethiobiotin synthetase